MNKFFKQFAPAFALVAAVVALAACGKKDDAAQAPAATAAKVYLVGVESAYAPFSAENEKKEVVGSTST
jgi:polar amino acid transport system substrate-binding protein